MTSIDPAASRYLAGLERAMDVAARRHELLAANIANADTPGYRTLDIDFDRAMAAALAGDGGAASQRARAVGGLPIRNDGNDVSIEREMIALGRTRHRYAFALEMARLRIGQIVEAIRDGRS